MLQKLAARTGNNMNRAKLGSVLFVGGLVVLLTAPSSEGEAMAGPAAGDAKVAADVDGPSRKEVNIAAGAAAVARAGTGAGALVNAGL
jgi:hypothetical protein